MSEFHDLLTRLRPIINNTGLEKAAGIPKNTLVKHFAWIDGKEHGQPIHEKHYHGVLKVLSDAMDGVLLTTKNTTTCKKK